MLSFRVRLLRVVSAIRKFRGFNWSSSRRLRRGVRHALSPDIGTPFSTWATIADAALDFNTVSLVLRQCWSRRAVSGVTCH